MQEIVLVQKQSLVNVNNFRCFVDLEFLEIVNNYHLFTLIFNNFFSFPQLQYLMEFPLFYWSPWNLVKNLGVKLPVQILHVLSAFGSKIIHLPFIFLVQNRQYLHAEEDFTATKRRNI